MRDSSHSRNRNCPEKIVNTKPRTKFRDSGNNRAKGRNAMNKWSNAKLCDVANLILGLIAFFSPWLFHFAAGAETINSLIVGVIIVVLSIAALTAFAVWEEWLNLIAGLWLIVSPWVLKFSGGTAMKVNVVIGIIVAVLAAIELFLMHQARPRITANR